MTTKIAPAEVGEGRREREMKDLLVILLLLVVVGLVLSGMIGMAGSAGGNCTWASADYNCGHWGTDVMFGK